MICMFYCLIIIIQQCHPLLLQINFAYSFFLKFSFISHSTITEQFDCVYIQSIYDCVARCGDKKLKEQNQNCNLVMFIRDYQNCQTKPFWAVDNTTLHSWKNHTPKSYREICVHNCIILLEVNQIK